MTQRHSGSVRTGVPAIQAFLLGAGAVLVAIGALLLVYIGLFAVDAISDPDSVRLIAIVLDRLQGSDRAIVVATGDGELTVGIDRNVATLVFLILCIWILGAFAAIVRTIVTTGLSVIGTARDWAKAEKS